MKKYWSRSKDNRISCFVVRARGRIYGVEDLSRLFPTANDFLFLGRGVHYPITLEGALKFKRAPTS